MLKVLVVDDDETILKLIKMRLEVEGYNAVTASSAEAALELARAEMFDVALLDYKLADKNGIALMSDLFQLNPEMPVIILTAYGTIKGAVEAMKKGAYGYITKPFDYDELLVANQKLFRKERTFQRSQETAKPGWGTLRFREYRWKERGDR